MARARPIIDKVSETPAELIQRYLGWLKAHPMRPGDNTAASVGFMMAQSIPFATGPDVAVTVGDQEPKMIYSRGNLFASGNALSGPGSARSSSDGFSKTSSVYVYLKQPGILTVNGADQMTVTLHHGVLVGSAPGPVESTSLGPVATLMLWAVPGTYVR